MAFRIRSGQRTNMQASQQTAKKTQLGKVDEQFDDMEKLNSDFLLAIWTLLYIPKPGRNQKQIKTSINLLQTIVHIVLDN